MGVSGTSTVAIKFKDGIMMATDTLGSYGSSAKYRNLQRQEKIGDHSLIGFTGDYGDFQYFARFLNECDLDDCLEEDGITWDCKQVHAYSGAVMFGRRMKFKPLFVQCIIGGVTNDNEPFLGYTDLIGQSYEENYICTGYGGHLALPIIRDEWHKDLTEAEAKALIEKCMKTLYFRDCRTCSKIQVGVAKAGDVTISEPYVLDMQKNWQFKKFMEPTKQSFGASW